MAKNTMVEIGHMLRRDTRDKVLACAKARHISPGTILGRGLRRLYRETARAQRLQLPARLAARLQRMAWDRGSSVEAEAVKILENATRAYFETRRRAA